MKKIILLVAIVLIYLQAPAQNTGHQEVPHIITVAFNGKYPSVKVKKWRHANNEYVASFTKGKRKTMAFYSKDATWLKTETDFKWMNQLPNEIKEAFSKSEYAGWYVSNIKKVDMPGRSEYRITVDNRHLLGAERPHELADHLSLHFTHKGELIKTVPVH